jgi:hypothetical protein
MRAGVKVGDHPTVIFLALALSVGTLALGITSARALTPSGPGAEVYFIDLHDGATVPVKLKLYFGLRNMGIAPAGSDRRTRVITIS